MRQYKVPLKNNGQRVDTFLFDQLAGIPASVLYKAFRKRSIKVNGQRVKESYPLSAGQEIEVYIPEEYLPEPLSQTKPEEPLIPIVYEDDYLLVVSKPQGLPVHQDKNQEDLVLDRLLHSYLRKRDNHPYKEGFPALCHRIDRNTGGLVVLAKDPSTLDVMLDKFKHHELKKVYHCLVVGTPSEANKELIAYLIRDKATSHVTVFNHPVNGADRIITRYRVLSNLGDYSLLEVELVTGKTHQIRAHLAFEGYPLVGDGKYGINSVNRRLKVKWQALWAVRLTFNFTTNSGHLHYLKDKTIALPRVMWEESLKHLFGGT